MKQLKLCALAAVFSLGSVAMADVSQMSVHPTQFTQHDMQALFADAGPSGKVMQVASLSQKEMKETEGAFVANFISAGAGGLGGGIGAWASGGSTGNIVASTAMGAAGGFVSPANGWTTFGVSLGGAAGANLIQNAVDGPPKPGTQIHLHYPNFSVPSMGQAIQGFIPHRSAPMRVVRVYSGR